MDSSVENNLVFKNNYLKEEKKLFLFSIGISLFLHIVVIVIPVTLLYYYSEQASFKGNFLEFSLLPAEHPANVQENISEKGIEEEIVNEEIISGEIISEAPDNFLDFSGANADTTILNQIYNEPTLNVTVRYPAGWVFIDQNRNNKLDGVTFWSALSTIVPPPYIHIEVKEKYLFNESRFKYKTKERNFTLYFNEPEEIEGEFTQIVYVRTNTSEDYSIKLIINGEESFRQYQPVFFGMVKTFSFGRNLF